MYFTKSIIICVLLFSALLNAADAQIVKPSESPIQKTEQFDAYLKEQADKGFSGSVLLARNNKIVLNKTYGKAANLGDSAVYWIASNSKSFVAAAILKLQEQGKLSVNDTLSRFFKGVPNDKQQIPFIIFWLIPAVCLTNTPLMELSNVTNQFKLFSLYHCNGR